MRLGVACIMVIAGAYQLHGGVVLTNIYVVSATANDVVQDLDDYTSLDPKTPLNLLIHARLSGYYSKTWLHYHHDLSEAKLSHNFDFSRAGPMGSFSYASGSSSFKVDTDTIYTLQGSLTNSSGVIHLGLRFRDLYSAETSPSATASAFASGVLLAGHSYDLYFLVSTRAEFVADAGARATGNVTITFNDKIAAIPEPSSLAVFGLGLIGVAGNQLRRFRQPMG